MTKPRILIVEDEPFVARDIQQQLVELGYEPVADTPLGEEAISLAEQLRPDLVLMDIQLKGEMDGITAAQIIKERFDLPVVFLTAFAGEETLDRAKKSDPFGYIIKPFDERELRTVIEMALYKHQAETQLRQGREERAAILSTTLDGFWLVDMQGRILEVNEACCRMHGYTRDEMLGKPLTDFDADETASETAAGIEHIKQVGSAMLERRHRCKDGHLIDVEVSITFLPGDIGRFSAFLRDITERKRAEEQLRLSEQTYSGILNSVTEAVYIQDENGIFLDVNLAVEKLYGYRKEEFIGRTPEFLSAPGKNDLSKLGPTLEKAFNGEPQSFEFWGLRKNGTIFPKDVSVSPGYYFGKKVIIAVARDITERKRSEEALVQNEDRYRDLVDNSHEVIATYDLEGNFLSANETAIRISGYPREALLKMNLADLVVPGMRHHFPEYLTNVRAFGKAHGIMQIQTASGEKRFWEYYSTVRTEGVAVPFVRGMGLDITERRQAEKALRASESQLQVILESTDDGILAVDQQGKILKTNRRFADLWKIPESILANGERQSLLDYVLAQVSDPDAFLEKVQSLYASDAADLDLIYFKDGRCFERFSSPMLEGSVITGRVWSFRDITGRKKAEDEARILTQRLTLATDAAAIGVWDWDLKTDLWYATPNYYTMLGYDPEEGFASREHWIESIHSEDRAAVGEKARRVLAGSDEPYEYEARIRHADGSYRWAHVVGRVVDVDAQGKANRMLGVRMDISERKHAEAALRESQDRYRDLIENSQELITTYDLEGNIISVNETAIRLTGYPREALLKMNMADLVVPKMRHLFPEYLTNLQTVGKAHGTMLVQIANGETRVWEYDCTLRTEGVAMPVVRGMALDITDRLHSEKALRASESQLQVILESTDDGILAVDLKGKILKTNSRFAELWLVPQPLIDGGDDQALLDHVLAQVSNSVVFLKRVQSLYATDATDLDEIHFKDGRCFERFSSPMLEGSVITGRVWSFRDITERKRAEQALIESHERFELANQATFNVIWDWDLKTNAIWRNDNFQTLFGYSRDEVETSFESSTNFTHPEDLERVKASFQVALDSKSEFWADEYRFRRKDGSYATVEDRAIITRDADGQAIRMLGAMQDISGRKQSEQALRESEEKLRVIIEHSAQLFYSHTPDNLLTYVSPQVDAFLGTGPEDTYRPWTDFLTDNPVNAIGVDLTRKAIETGERQPSYELELLSARGRKLWVEVHESPVVEQGKTIAMVGALTDITESKLAHDQLRLQGSALEAASNAIAITDRRGVIQWVNPAFTTLTGYSATEAVGSRPGDLVKSGKQDQAFYVAMWATILAGDIWRGEIINRRKDGSLYTGEKIITPLKDDRGAITHFTSVEQDITQRKQAELELSHLNRSLKMLSACNEALVRADSEQELLAVICQIAVDIGGYRMAWVGYAQDDASRTVTPMAYAGEEKGYLSEMKVTWSENEPSGMGPVGRAIRSSQASLFEDITLDPATSPWLEAMQQRGFRGVISLPLRYGNRNRTFGVLTLYTAEVFHLTEKDLDLLQKMADDLAFGIGNIRAQLERKQQASLLDKAHDAIMVRDMDNRILFWNKGAEGLYGWTSEEMIGRSVVDIFYDDPTTFHVAQELVLLDGEWDGKIQQQRKDGNLFTIEAHWTLVRDEQDQPRSVLAINTDITERVEAERDLHQYTERLEAMREIDAALLGARSTTELAQGALTRLRHIVPFERASVVLFDQGLTEGTILAVDQNQPWLPLAGEVRPIGDFHDLKDLLSAPFLDLPDLSDLHGCILEELMLTQGLRNLVYIPMESEGTVLGFLALSATAPGMLTPQHAEIALDMTDQLVVAIQHTRLREELELSNQVLESKVEKRTTDLRTTVATMQILEGELRQREAEARSASEAKSTFLASMSHELRTPLIGITGMLEILTQSDLDAEQRQMVNIIHESSESLLQIIGDVLDFSKIEANKLELAPHTFSARALMESVSQTFRSAISAKGLNFITEVDPRLAPAHVGDALLIRQALNNFMSNAVKFTERGSITLRLWLVEPGDGRESMAFEVQDTGIGVSPKNQVKLFQPFTQAEASTTRRFGGTGLGLVITRRLAELMGGSLTMQSTLGHGTTLTLAVNLPVGNVQDIVKADVPDPSKTVLARPAPSIEAAEQERSLVLMAEDHPTNRIVLIQQVNRAGYALEVAVDGQEAFEKWQSGRYAVILTDLHMPRMDGYQLTKAVRDWERAHKAPRTPILVLTANALRGEAARCLELGMDDYLIKPVTIPLLASKLRQWMPHVKLGEAAPESPATLATPLPMTVEWIPGVDSKTLMDLCGGNAVAAREILADFIATTKADIQVMQDGLRQKDRSCIARQAHRIKGSAAVIGARGLVDRAAKLEAYARTEPAEWETIQEHMQGLQEALKVLDQAE